MSGKGEHLVLKNDDNDVHLLHLSGRTGVGP